MATDFSKILDKIAADNKQLSKNHKQLAEALQKLDSRLNVMRAGVRIEPYPISKDGPSIGFRRFHDGWHITTILGRSEFRNPRTRGCAECSGGSRWRNRRPARQGLKEHRSEREGEQRERKRGRDSARRTALTSARSDGALLDQLASQFESLTPARCDLQATLEFTEKIG